MPKANVDHTIRGQGTASAPKTTRTPHQGQLMTWFSWQRETCNHITFDEVRLENINSKIPSLCQKELKTFYYIKQEQFIT